MEKEKIKVLYVQPNKYPEVIEIGTALADLQAAVGGYIETCGICEDEDSVIVLNEEGKMNGMMPNRALYNDDNELVDIIFGPFFVCDGSGESFGSLNDEQIIEYTQRFFMPEMFTMSDGKITVMPYSPEVQHG